MSKTSYMNKMRRHSSQENFYSGNLVQELNTVSGGNMALSSIKLN